MSGVDVRSAGRSPRLKIRATGKHRLRRVAFAGVPAVMAVGVGLPLMLTSGNVPAKIGSAAVGSRMLCGSWSRCDERGYNSYGYASHEYRPYWRMSAGDECTNYAAFVESTVYHARRPSYLLGNGGDWAYSAASHHVRVNHTPSVGAVAEWNGGSFGIGPSGHVAVVEEVGPHASYIVVSQQHMGGLYDYNWTLIRAHHSSDSWQEWPSNFIHFAIPRRSDVGYYNPKTRTFKLRYSQTAGPANRTGSLGVAGAIPLMGDWRGTGLDGTGYYDPATGTFHLDGVKKSRHPDVAVSFGPAHMKPLVGDWLGTGKDGLGYYDPATGTFNLEQSLTGGKPGFSFVFGQPGMVPLAGDWNGGRHDGIGFYNPAKGTFTLRNSLSAGAPLVSFRFGPPHMIPIVGNWAGGRKDGVGYYNPRTGKFYLRDRLSNGPATTVVRFGPAHMVPLTGDWLGA
jgi:surface antigen